MADLGEARTFESIESALAAGWLPVSSALWWPGQSGLRIAEIIEPQRSIPGRVRFGDSITIAEATQPQNTGWVDVGAIASCEDERENIKVDVGSGGFGGGGCIAVFARHDGSLRWALFCDESNPFVQATISGDRIVALSDLGVEWSISLDDPRQIALMARR